MKAPEPAKESSNDISIETSKLDDTNFDNLGKSLDSGKSQDDIKKEVNSMADQLASKDAAEKQKAAEDKKAADESQAEEQKPEATKENTDSLSIETSSLADPFEAQAESKTAAKKDDKPKESIKVQLKHKHHKKHAHKKHQKKEETPEGDIDDMIQIS